MVLWPRSDAEAFRWPTEDDVVCVGSNLWYQGSCAGGRDDDGMCESDRSSNMNGKRNGAVLLAYFSYVDGRYWYGTPASAPTSNMTSGRPASAAPPNGPSLAFSKQDPFRHPHHQAVRRPRNSPQKSVPDLAFPTTSPTSSRTDFPKSPFQYISDQFPHHRQHWLFASNQRSCCLVPIAVDLY
jgi:hypothetical protein